MTVRQNRSDQLIGSNWIRRANPERLTVGRGLPIVGRGLPTVGRGLPTVGCPPWASHRGPWAAHRGPWAARRGLPTVGRSRTSAQNVRIFIARGCPTTREIRLSIFFESCWAHWGAGRLKCHNWFKSMAMCVCLLGWTNTPKL